MILRRHYQVITTFAIMLEFYDWQRYFEHNDRFGRFCCYLNIVEMLSTCSNVGKTQVAWQWPIDR